MTDQIEKEIIVRAPRSRVWHALVDQTEFGTWFRVDFPPGTFTTGQQVSGMSTYPGCEHMPMDVDVIEVIPEERLSYRWKASEASETKTLVTFTLENVSDGTRVRVVESGFDQIPEHLRGDAYRSNDQGWAEQMDNIARHVTTE